MDKWTAAVVADFRERFDEHLYTLKYVPGIVISISGEGSVEAITTFQVPEQREVAADFLRSNVAASQVPWSVLSIEPCPSSFEEDWRDELSLYNDLHTASTVDNLKQMELRRRHTLLRQPCPVCDRQQRNSQLRRVLKSQNCGHIL